MMTETFRARIYTGQPMTRALAMHYACSRAGLGGECTRRWPQSYLDTHIVENDGHEPMDADKARAVAGLLADGWIERREITRHRPADIWFGAALPEHEVTLVTYYATDKGRAAWADGK